MHEEHLPPVDVGGDEIRPEPTLGSTGQAPDVDARHDSPRPADIPEKFWDAEAGSIRTQALLKSYLQLERKLGSMVPLPNDGDDAEGQARLRRAMGVPDSPEDYQIEPPNDVIEADANINAKLHDAGFNPQQAQLVYDLAAEHLLPLLDDAASELDSTRDGERLAAHFGGDDAWQTMARQIKTWAEANLVGDVFETLATSYDGVLAMHQMMQAREPSVLRATGTANSEPDETALTAMMRDPRYWRDRDPALVAKVTKGFQRLYPT